ncbi:uracil-DNA glycosylase [Candidatus Kryptobacter tengchongensis]|uniref:Type-5 uracil-DNA glycosylase n=1 Tax=Kryptobacter tengchongensis TaxID=1643429 RepID=A0A916PCM4_KRYT1|nr:uracil-DNA glycosylase [Candidatus Kryptobacter tengchongensis]CUT04633.1 uracil-DNA glycosylase, family 4 [Candidatus Kryptobacter tengchongensis]
MNFRSLEELNKRIINCRKCPRLVKWREKIAKEKVARFKNWNYWGKPVPGFGDPQGKLLIIGLAPAAHGGNRTGRMFTGDRSGDWLYRALFKFGFANQPESISKDDGLKLNNCYITAIVRCAPPENKPDIWEIKNCNIYLRNEFELLKEINTIVTLGGLAFSTTVRTLLGAGFERINGNLKFKHGNELTFINHKNGKKINLICSYHPSQRNTFTGKLTEEIFDKIFIRAKELIEK